MLASACPRRARHRRRRRFTLDCQLSPTRNLALTYAPTLLSENPKFLDSGDLEVTVGWSGRPISLPLIWWRLAHTECRLGNTRRKKKSKAVSLFYILGWRQRCGSNGGEFYQSMIFFVNRLYVADGGQWRTHTITHTYIYIYIYICTCCMAAFSPPSSARSVKLKRPS